LLKEKANLPDDRSSHRGGTTMGTTKKAPKGKKDVKVKDLPPKGKVDVKGGASDPTTGVTYRR
jgi:hypothetical protein